MRYWPNGHADGFAPALAKPTDAADTAQNAQKRPRSGTPRSPTLRKLMHDSVRAMAQRMPEAQRERFRAVHDTHVRPEVAGSAMIAQCGSISPTGS